MNLNVHEWKEFYANRIFDIKYGVNLELNTCEESSDNDAVNFVSRTEENNGVSSKVKKIEGVNVQKAGLITVAGGGSVLSTFVQPEEFYSGRDLYTLEVKTDVSDEVKHFLVTIIRLNKYKYNYGRQANKTLPLLKLELPIQHNTDGTPYIDVNKKYSDDGYVPDWHFMEDYIKSLHYKPLTTEKKKGHSNELRVEKWKWFSLKGISNVYTGGDLILSIVDDGEIPVASHKVENNGVGALVDKIENRQLFDCKKTIALADRGCFHASVQTEDFYIGTRVKALEMKCCVSKGVLVFIATIINQETFKYSYGRNCTAGVENVRIKLPVKHNDDGTIFIDDKHTYSEEGYVPDWKFMEDYIKSLPYGDRL